MTGLPRATDTTTHRSVFGLMLLDSFERLTNALRRGDPFSETALDDMRKLRSRYGAFADALDARLKFHGLIEDDLSDAS